MTPTGPHRGTHRGDDRQVFTSWRTPSTSRANARAVWKPAMLWSLPVSETTPRLMPR
jgi:hypothetical protein